MSALVARIRGGQISRLKAIVLATASVVALAAFSIPAQVLAQQDQPAGGDQSQAADPPTRVGRVSFVQGTVSYHTADQTQWDQAAVNVPVTTGDAFYTDQGGRATIQVGRAYLRLDSQTEVDVDTLDDTNAIMYVPQGSVNLTMRAMNEGEVYEILTPGGTVQINTPGRYRVDVTSDGTPPKLTVLQGSADIFGDNTRVTVNGGQSSAVVVDQAPPPVQPAVETPIDTWSQQQDSGLATIPDYINPDVPGVDQTVDTGQWAEDPNYGRVWYPPDPNWVPFQQGSWEYRQGYDWTWVDDAPWAFGPSHYGRTVIIDGRWAWVPGPGLVIEPEPPGVVVVEQPVLVPPIFAPAVVTFIDVPPVVVGVGVGVGPVFGWIPLAPGEVYVPPFYASPVFVNQINIFGGCGCWGGGGYRNTNITNVNITNITNVNITNINNVNNVTINNYHNRVYASAVPQSTFVGSRHVGPDRLNIPQNQIQNTTVNRRPAFAPTAQTRGAPQSAWNRGGGNAPAAPNAGPRRPPAPGPAIRPVPASAPATGTRPGTRPAPPQRQVPGATHAPNQTAAAGAGPRIVAPPNRSPAPGTRPGTRPGQQPTAQPGTRPGQQPGTQPGTRPGQQPSTQPAATAPGTRPPSRGPTAGPGTRPGAPVTPPPGNKPGAAPQQRPGTTPSTAPTPGNRPGAAPQQRPGTTPSTAPTTPGNRPGATPQQRPGTTPSTAPATPGNRPGATPQQRPGTTPTTAPGSRPGPQPGPRPGAPVQPQTRPQQQPHPQPTTQPGTTPRPQPQPQQRPQTQPKSQPQPQPQSRQPATTPPRPQPQSQPRPQPQPQAQPRPQQQQPTHQPAATPPRPQPQPQARPQQQQQPRPQPQAQPRPQPQQQPQHQPAATPPRPQPQPQPQARPQQQQQPRPQPQPQAQPRPQPQPQARPQPQQPPRPQPQPQPQPRPQPQAQPQQHPQPQQPPPCVAPHKIVNGKCV